MIIVTGSVQARPEAIDEVVHLSLEHVQHWRPGCLLHSVHHDVEDPNRLVFVEHSALRAALDTHFPTVPASGTFVQALGPLAAEPPTIEIYDAQPLAV